MSNDADGGLAAMLVSQAQAHIQGGRNEAALLLALRAQDCLTDQPDPRVSDNLAGLYISLSDIGRALDILEALPSTAARRRLIRTASFAAAADPGSIKDEASRIAKRLLRLPPFRTTEIQAAAEQTGAIFDDIDEGTDAAPADYTKSYTICMTPRSGSTFLTKLMEQSGVFGYPQEYLHRLEASALPGHARRYGTNSWQTYLNALARNTCSTNGVFGIKADPNMLLPLLVDGTFDETLAKGKFIYITRNDILGQAISLTRAQYTGVWSAGAAARATVAFDFSVIHDNITHLAEMMSRWEIIFALNGITPLRLTYEQLDADPKATLVQIANFLCVAPPAITIPPRSYQRDDMSTAWRTQFLALLS